MDDTNSDEVQRLRNTVAYLTEEIGPRPPGSMAERSASEYLVERFRELGLNAEVEPFECGSHGAQQSILTHVETGRTYNSLPCQFCALGEIEGRIVFVGDCDTVLREDADFSDKIGLLIPSGDHVKRMCFLLALEKRGMAGVIVVSPHLDSIITKLIRYPEVRIPVVAVSFRTAAELKRLEGEKMALVVEGADTERHESQNVVATLPGDGTNWLVVSSHYDSAPSCPGASDDASGTAVVIELARRMKESARPASIVLLLTGSEEYGDNDGTARGALAFYERHVSELGTCIGHVDTDDLGNILSIPQLYLSGPKPFRETALDDSLRMKYCIRGRSGWGCDHGAAEKHGIPYVWFTDLASGNHPQLHTPEDTIDLLDFNLMAGFLDDIQDVVERLSRLQPVYPFIEKGGILIRPARDADIPRILEITKLSFVSVSLDALRQEFFDEPVDGKEWHVHKNTNLANYCKEHILWMIVAEIDDEVVGYASYGLNGTTGQGSIGNNAVHPDHQGKGIGTRLQGEIDRRIKEEGRTKFEVSTLSHDIPAQRMYEKLGYKKVAETFHYLKKE